MDEFLPRNQHFINLLKKIDIIPPKMVLAQAALESSWGKSRFALDGYNYFGIRCMSAGCGYKPKNAEGEHFMVKSYASPLSGLRDYARLLNASIYYKDFRDIRISYRLNGRIPDPMEVAKGLKNFSSKRQAYINSLIILMRNNFTNF